MKWIKRHVIPIIAILGTMVLGLGIYTATALAGTTQAHDPGPFYGQGQFVGICVADRGTGATDYFEVNTNFGTYGNPNTNAIGNCAGSHTQLVVEADPALYPVPQPSSSSSSSSMDTVTVTNPGGQNTVLGTAFGPLDIRASSNLGYTITEWSETGLPAGLTFSTSTIGGQLEAVISGTPTGPTGTFLVTVTAADTGLVTGTASFNMTVSNS